MSTPVAFLCVKLWLIMMKVLKKKEKKKIIYIVKKNKTPWNVDELRRVSLYTHRKRNHHPLREFWLIKQALCAGINNAEAMWELWCAQRPAVSLMHAVNTLITRVKTTALGAVDGHLFREVGSRNWIPVLLIPDTHQIRLERLERPRPGTKWI